MAMGVSLDARVSSAKVTPAAFRVRRLGAFLGAEVTGIDLRQDLNDSTVDALRRTLAEHAVLAFPDQNLEAEDLKRFGRYLGPLSVHPFSTNSATDPELIVFDNKEGNPPAATDIWHSDETFRAAPPFATCLLSKIMPDVGGDTAFCSMSAVYAGLSDRMQRFLSGLEAIHDFKPFRDLFGKDRQGVESLRRYEEMYPPVTHPVVTVHPETGCKVLFVNPQFTLRIKGMADDESRTVLDMLFRKTTTHEYQYRHRWQPNMLVVWDNRSTQHSALHDYYPQRRHLLRVTVAGTSPISDGPAADEADLRRYLMPPISKFRETSARRQHQA
ncbi:MAG: TauD/TfdA family dioxygenase [Xanthobacteraceae bacterium]|nr:TauD/TfdA family dioxygenase [Xanthobacteraceae bacterium]